jgi:Holliday junction resolvase RusA-like endonuclease
MASVHLTIRGLPVSQKNSRSIGWAGGHPRSFSSSGVKSWHREAAIQLMLQWRHLPPLDLDGRQHREVRARVLIYQGERQRLDVDNAAAAPLDALKRAGVITNDYWINPLTVERHRDEERPRVEIYLD